MFDWVWETKNCGTGIEPLKSKFEPPRDTGNGSPIAASGRKARSTPKTEAIVPGASPCPAVKLAALTTPPELMFGDRFGGASIINNNGAEIPPPGEGLTTATVAVPGPAMSAAETAACRRELSRKTVGRGSSFHRTTESGTKADPTTVSVMSGAPATRAAGDRDESTGAGESVLIA